MKLGRTAIGILAIGLFLSGCNTTDALTPQVDVGGGHTPSSSPVTDRDLQQMAATQQPVYPSQPQAAAAQAQPQQMEAPIQGQPLGAPLSSRGGIYAAPAQPGPGAPPSTLEQQASRLAEPAPQAQQAAPPASPQPQPQPQPQQTASAQPAAASGNTLRFLPIIGAPLPAVTPLSRQLAAEARAKGISIKGSSDTSARHVLKGYFSAVAGGGNVTVTYVWDVLDNYGARLNRIQGQETFAGNATDPWSAVPPSVMQTIAAKTIDSYAQWSSGP